MSLNSILSSSSIIVELSGSESCGPLASAMLSPKSSEMPFSRGDLHSDMDLMPVESAWLVLHVALPYNEQQDIDLEEYVVVERSTFDFLEDPLLVCLALKGNNIDLRRVV